MPKLLTAAAPEPSSPAEPGNGARPFAHHGVELAERGNQREGDCPFCAASGKFTVHADTGLWRCWVCSRTGNPLEFLRQLHEVSVRGTDAGWYEKFAADRKLIDPESLRAWGACRSAVDGKWMLAGYSVRGELVQLYRRVQVQSKDGSWSWVMLPTPGVWPEGRAHGLHMPATEHDPARGTMYVAEGPWDGVALWEIARQAKRTGDQLEFTGNSASSLLGDACVVAVPGCSVWQDAWTEMCRGRVVVLLYDNDHPGDSGAAAGRDGMRRVGGRLLSAAKEVHYLQWGGGGFDASLPDGFDVRDYLSKGVS